MARRGRLFAVALAAVSFLVAVRGAEEEEVPATPVESAISVMLLGSIGFQMLLFYLVHWEDADIRRYSWRVISQTISIFCAVLLFQGFNGLVEEYIIAGGSEAWEVAVDMGQLVWWLTLMQVILAITSGAINEMWGGAAPNMEVVEVNVKSLAVLFAHVAGFSAINAWGALQQSILKASPLTCLIAVPVGWCGLFVMYQGYHRIRSHISNSDDGEIDEYEQVWDDETKESENDVAGLSLSFVTVQAIRFAIGGVLPNGEGIEGPSTQASHGGSQWQMLLLCGVGFEICGILLLNSERCIPKHSAMFERVERIIEILNNYFTFGNAWCFFYGVKWWLTSTQFTDETALLHVVLSLVLSSSAFAMIFVLDKVMDNQLLGEDSELAENAVEKLITGLAILIGFSWEQCFDTAVTVIAESQSKKCPEAIAKLIMSVILVLVVFPAWRLYILPQERELNEEATEEGLKKSTLKAAGSQYYKLMLEAGTEEHALDLAHLKMKEHRRTAHDLPHPGLTAAKGLKHLRVTAKGIAEVDNSAEHLHSGKEKKRTAHRKSGVEEEDLLS
mmetsp:Transcript_29909/g.81043  ORF Transcript_29909/g.81043 Transcript_29909/m.81043 type:complete len:559 (-) Transcript_29909:169-1845(-)